MQIKQCTPATICVLILCFSCNAFSDNSFKSSQYKSIDDLVFHIEEDDKNGSRYKEKISEVMDKYFDAAKGDDIAEVKSLYYNEDGSRDEIAENYNSVDDMFRPIRKFKKVHVTGPVYKWGEYLFPHVYFTPSKSEYPHDIKFFICKEECFLSDFIWVNYKELSSKNHDVLVGFLVRLHTKWRNKIESNIDDIDAKSCIHPPEGEAINPICVGVSIHDKNSSYYSNNKYFQEANIEFDKFISAINDDNRGKLGIFFDDVNKSKVAYYNDSSMNKKNEDSEKPFFSYMGVFEVVNELKKAESIDVVGASNFDGVIFVFYEVIKNGNKIIQFMPYETKKRKFIDASRSINSALSVLLINEVAQDIQKIDF